MINVLTANNVVPPVEGPVRSRTPEAGRETRERVLQAAARLFSRRGYSGVSIADVALAAGVSKAGLLHHFASKETLFLSVAERFSLRSWLPPQATEDSSFDLWDYLDAWCRSLVEDRTQPDLVALSVSTMVGALDVEHPAREVVRESTSETLRRLVEAVEVGKRLGQVAPEAPSEEIARGLVAISSGGQAQWLVGASLGLPAGPAGGELAALFVALARARWGQEA